MRLLDLPMGTGRSQSIDALRAVFALWVLFAHVLPWADYYSHSVAAPPILQLIANSLIRIFQPPGETHPAVLGFIVLSGYCIHLAGLRNGNADLRSYAVRRLFRIYPVYLLAIVVGVFGFLMNAPFAAPDTVVAGTSSIRPQCIASRVLALGAIYPPVVQCSLLGNAPLNTVMVEIWLYIAYPVLLLGVARHYGEHRLWQIVVATWIFGIVVISFSPELNHWWNVASLPGFLLYWWIGAKVLDPQFALALRRNIAIVVGMWFVLSLILILGIRFPSLQSCARSPLRS